MVTRPKSKLVQTETIERNMVVSVLMTYYGRTRIELRLVMTAALDDRNLKISLARCLGGERVFKNPYSSINGRRNTETCMAAVFEWMSTYEVCR